MRICVIGTGYVGLVVGTCLAGSGNDVTCTDTDESKISTLNSGDIPIYEPGLAELVRTNLGAGRLQFTTDVAGGVRDATFVFIAVGTPPGEDGAADLQYVKAVAQTIADNINSFKIIVVKSTVPVGTCDMIRALIHEHNPKAQFAVVSNPEFLKEGHAVEDFLRPDRIILGTNDPTARDLMNELYAPFNRTSNRMLFMDVRSCEMTKYASNAMLATRISFMNEVAGICEAAGANVEMVRRGMGADPRIGNKFIFPGVGFGGSCFPKDLRALIKTAHQSGREASVLDAVLQVNDRQKRHLVDRIRDHFGQLDGLTVAIWGLAFKPRTDDIREAPALTIIEGLLEEGATVQASDPVALKHARAVFGDRVHFVDNEYEAVEGADALVVATEWNAYRQPDFERIRTLMKHPVVFDGRNLYDPDRMSQFGFHHYSIGRPHAKPIVS